MSRDGGLHPGAWWVWALGLAAAASRTTNPLLLLLLASVIVFAVVVHPSARRTVLGFFARIAAVVLALRLALAVVFTSPFPGHTVVRLPSVPVPSVFAGLRIGGPVTAESLLAALDGGMQLAVLLLAAGAASALADPRSLLRCLPAALYEVGVAVSIAVALAPQFATAARRVREARRLRGEAGRGPVVWLRAALPVLHGALERSIDLAAAMDARGFGRRGPVRPWRRHVVTAALVVALLACAAATYGLLSPGFRSSVSLPLLAAGVGLAAAGMIVGRRDAVRSRYRPPRWTPRAWLVAAGGAAAVVSVVLAGHLTPGSLTPTGYPLTWPQVPTVAVAGALGAALSALSAGTPDTVPRTLRAGTP
ncbi:MAG: hypothetical protein K6T28_03635 [Acidothermus sp.]|nr:hypothetical protein [Acidothermus sp.]